MTKTIDEQILKRLIRANAFINHAKEHSFRNNDFDLMIAIHNLDNAIETVLRILIDYLDIENKAHKTIETAEMASLIGEVQKFCKDNNLPDLPSAAQIKRLRVLRNCVQHGAVLPTSEIAPLCHLAAKFFAGVLKKYFELNADELKLSSVITDEILKGIIAKSEMHLDRKEYIQTVVASRDAFEYAKLIYISPYKTFDRMPFLFNDNKEIVSELEKMSTRIEISNHRIDLNAYDYFMDCISHIPFEHCAEWSYNRVMQRDWEERDASFCYNFVVDAITKFQFSQLPPLQHFELDRNQAVRCIYTIDNVKIIEIDNDNLYPGTYIYPEAMGHRFFVGKEVADSLRIVVNEAKIDANESFTLISETKTMSGKKINKSKEEIEVNRFSCNLVSNYLPAWEVNLWYSTKKAKP